MRELEDILPLLIPIIIFLIPIIAILTSHQRKMAELMHGQHEDTRQDEGVRREIEALRHEVAALRQRVDDQTLAIDGIDRTRLAEPARPPIPDAARQEDHS